ncbi:MAG: hypothetical protein ACYCZ6_17500 [Polaromonas sp.]
MSAAQPAVLSPRARALVSTVMIALSASAMLTPESAKAQYVWGGPGATPPADQSALPASSAGRWGDMLGGAVGRAAGVALGGGGAATTAIGRSMQDISSGVGQEVGRNLGRAAAQMPYQSGAAVARAGNQSIQQSIQATPDIERDYLDKLGLDAVFANGRAVQARSGPAQDYRSAQALRDSTMRDFELALRSTTSRGFTVDPWMDVRTALQQPLGSVPEYRFTQYAETMSARLQRPGGPGYQTGGTARVNSLEALRISMQQQGYKMEADR